MLGIMAYLTKPDKLVFKRFLSCLFAISRGKTIRDSHLDHIFDSLCPFYIPETAWIIFGKRMTCCVHFYNAVICRIVFVFINDKRYVFVGIFGMWVPLITR